MLFLMSLLARPPRCHDFVKIDKNGICVALIRCTQSPGDSWAEVDDLCMSWLGRPFTSRGILIPAGQPDCHLVPD